MLEKWIKFISYKSWTLPGVYLVYQTATWCSLFWLDFDFLEHLCLFAHSTFKLHMTLWHKRTFIFNIPPSYKHAEWISVSPRNLSESRCVLWPSAYSCSETTARKEEEFRKLWSDPASCIQLHDLITLRGLIYVRFTRAAAGFAQCIHEDDRKPTAAFMQQFQSSVHCCRWIKMAQKWLLLLHRLRLN